MRVLLAHNSTYYPAHGGGERSNRLLVEALAARGHDLRVLARLASFGEREHARYLDELAARGVPALSAGGGEVVFRLNGAEVHVLAGQPRLRAWFTAELDAFSPHLILASTDDPAQVMLDAALAHPSARVIYLARATLALPFGPDCAFPSAEKTEALRRAGAAVGVSEYVARYMRRWGGLDAVHVPISLMEPGPEPPPLGRFENEFVTLVNPCAVKGISIFIALAERMPEVSFAAVPTWGTTEQDAQALRAHPNIAVLAPLDNIGDLLARTRVLLVPSLWAEARSRIVVEAMLRGVPVMASDVGGIPEAKLGVPYLLPVHPIERYRPEVDQRMVPVAEVPPQDVGPWERTLRRLLTDRAHYEEISRASRDASLRYVRELSVEPFEKLLEDVLRQPMRNVLATAQPSAAREKLSPEKRQLLALRLRKALDASWFPNPGEEARLRLFAFPHAGAGASALAGWADKLPAGISPLPVRLPGRETRASEPPYRDMPGLVDALSHAIGSHLERPFAFFGHSMGAGVAFELTRRLRAGGRPLPLLLIVSGARAPRYRRDLPPQPEPSDDDLLGELRSRDGVPDSVLADPEAMRLILPPLRADTTLYRNYRYLDQPPLSCAIRAYGGADDPHVRPEHLEAWRAETTSDFAVRLFPGGHFYLRTAQAEFFDALGRDLEAAISALR